MGVWDAPGFEVGSFPPGGVGVQISHLTFAFSHKSTHLENSLLCPATHIPPPQSQRINPTWSQVTGTPLIVQGSNPPEPGAPHSGPLGLTQILLIIFPYSHPPGVGCSGFPEHTFLIHDPDSQLSFSSHG